MQKTEAFKHRSRTSSHDVLSLCNRGDCHSFIHSFVHSFIEHATWQHNHITQYNKNFKNIKTQEKKHHE